MMTICHAKRRKTADTELKNAVKATDTKAQYDASAKRLLGQKSILAHILVKTVDEFRGMNPKEVVSYIEGQPYIGTVPVEPGLTNTSSVKDGQRIVGFNSENGELNEGLVRFDYDDIKRVYSIWVCMHMDENSMNHIHLTNDNVLGSYEWKGKIDLLNIVMIGLAEELPGHDERYELHRLLLIRV